MVCPQKKPQRKKLAKKKITRLAIQFKFFETSKPLFEGKETHRIEKIGEMKKEKIMQLLQHEKHF